MTEKRFYTTRHHHESGAYKMVHDKSERFSFPRATRDSDLFLHCMNTLAEENEQLASELVECKALIIMLSDTTVSGRVDNLIYNRYNFYSEDEYYEKLEEYKNKVIKELLE